uniref:Uncharacterized protein n=1 Tax=Helianthus annuus TaxID=4232 RepID=A0A251T0W3_HELAN
MSFDQSSNTRLSLIIAESFLSSVAEFSLRFFNCSLAAKYFIKGGSKCADGSKPDRYIKRL